MRSERSTEELNYLIPSSSQVIDYKQHCSVDYGQDMCDKYFRKQALGLAFQTADSRALGGVCSVLSAWTIKIF